MKGLWHCAGLVALALLLPASPSAGASPAGEWVLINEPRSRIGHIDTAAAEPGRILLGLTEAGGAPPVHVGVWLSDDGGTTWDAARLDAGTAPAGSAITLAPDGTAYLLSGLALYRLPPGETEWIRRVIGYLDMLAPPGYIAHGMQPDAPIWAAVNGQANERRRLFRYDPVTTSSLQLRLPDNSAARHVHALAVDRQNPERILLATSSQPQASQASPVRLWITADRGGTWSTPSISGLPAVGIRRIDLDGQRMHAAFAGEYGGLFVREPGASMWAPVLPGALAGVDVHDFSIDAASGEVVAVATAEGVRVPAGGGSWAAPGGAGSADIAWSAHVGGGGTLYAGIGDEGLFQMAHGDTGLAPVAGAINPPPTTSIAVRPGVMAQMALSESGSWNPTQARLLGSSEGGASWTLLSEGLAFNRIQRTLVSASGVAWAQGSAPGDGGTQSLYRREGNGVWHDRTPSVGTTRATRLGLLQQIEGMPARVLATSREDRTGSTTAYPLRLWISDNGGFSWSNPLTEPNIPLAALLDALDPGWAPEMLLAGLQNQSLRIFHSDDGGDSWATRQPSGLPDPFGPTAHGCVAGARTGSPRVYLLGVSNNTSRLHLSWSTDAGVNWQLSGWGSSFEQVGYPSAIACDPDDADRVWVGTRFGQVFASTDGGVDFARLEGGHPAPGGVQQMLLTDAGLYLASELGAFVWLATATPGLSVDNVGSRMRPRLRVEWWDGQAQTQLLRDGVVVANGGATGTHEESLELWNLPVRYQACAADGSVCSDEVEFRR